MAKLLVLLGLWVMLSLTTGCSSGSVYGGTTLAPPHNEEPVDGYVARYRAFLGVEGNLGSRVNLALQYTRYGLQTWQPPEVVGNGMEAWEGSDWSVEQMRHQFDWSARVRLIGPLFLTGQGIEGNARPYHHWAGFELRHSW